MPDSCTNESFFKRREEDEVTPVYFDVPLGFAAAKGEIGGATIMNI